MDRNDARPEDADARSQPSDARLHERRREIRNDLRQAGMAIGAAGFISLFVNEYDGLPYGEIFLAVVGVARWRLATYKFCI